VSDDIKRPTSFDECYPSRFLKASLFKQPETTLRIADVFLEALQGDDGKSKQKLILAFRGTDKQLVACKTNGICLREMFGPNPQDWVGKLVTFYAGTDRNPSTGKMEPCVRVWGSPELERDRTISIVLPKKKPKTAVMHAVRKGAPATKPASVDEPGPDDLPEPSFGDAP